MTKNKKMLRHLSLWASMFLFAALLLLSAMEIITRLAGYKPVPYIEFTNEPVTHEYDAVTGWRNKPGTYSLPPYISPGENIHITILPEGHRKTSPNPGNAGDKIIAVGGSFTQGWAISDHETYPWKLQEFYPEMTVLNYGTGGFGTYQSLLVLERELSRLKSTRVVVYGFMADHEFRNVAASHWLEMLSRYSRRAHVYLPYVTIYENGDLVRHPPIRHPILPMRDVFAVIPIIERALTAIPEELAGRVQDKRKVTEQILLTMNDVVHAYNAKFLVAILWADDSTLRHYTSFLKQHRIAFAPCSLPPAPELVVKGEGHPNGNANTIWARCIRNGVDHLLE